MIALNQRRTHLFTLPRQTNSEFTVFRGGRDPSKHSGGSDCHPREYLPASQRQTHLHATCTAGRTRWGTEAGQRRRGFSDHEFTPATVPIESARETIQRKNLEVGAQGFWMRHLRVSCLCFCWTPMVTSPKLHGQSRSVSTAAKKLHSMASAWENFCEIITCRAANTYFPVGATFFGPFSNTQIDFACLPAMCSRSQMLRTAPRRR